MKRILILIIASCISTATRAQLFDSAAAQAELVANLMGTGQVLSASVTVTREKGTKQLAVSENLMVMRRGDLRFESKPVVDPLLAKQFDRLRREGLTEVVTILLPGANKAWLVLPGRKGYIEAVVDDGAAKEDSVRKENKLITTETIDGHPCEVWRVTITGNDESRQVVTVWKATDLEGFILQSRMDHGDDTMEVLRFSNIRREKPDDALFALPADYKQLKPETAASVAGIMMEFDLDRDAAFAEQFR
jgi:hypothetical protein